MKEKGKIMKKMKRFSAVFLTFIMVLSLFANTKAAALDDSTTFSITNGVLNSYNSTQTNVVVPAGVTEIADTAFQNSGVTSVTLPEGLTKIGRYVFNYCTSLKTINIPDTVTSIGDGTFKSCTSLKSITIPDSVTTIGTDVFSGDTTVIYGSDSSAAHTYAQNNKINFRETGTSYPIYSGSFSGATKSEKLENAVEKAFSYLKKDMNEFEKAEVMHDYLVLNTKYDYANYVNNTIPYDDYTAYGVLVNHIGVCGGYASAYAVLMNLLGIETDVAMNDDHAWNLVKLNGNWYHIDTTWDDPIPDRPGITAYDFFVLSDSKIKNFSDHESWYSGVPSATDTQFDNNFWGAYTHADFNKLQTPVIASVALDTSSYKNTVGTTYKFLAKSNIGEYVYAKAADSSIVQIEETDYDADHDGWLIPIKGLKAGTTTITAVSASGATASFPVTFKNNFESDTNGSFSVLSGSTYQFMITAPSRPTFSCGSSSFKVVASSSSGNKYYYKVQAIGTPGQGCGFYVNGAFIAAATIIVPPAYSDTTGTFNVTAGNTYQFMITSAARPTFGVGSGSFKLVSSFSSGNRYYYRVQAVGSAGQGSGFYVNGRSIAVANIIAPVSSSDTTGTFSVKKGNTYQFMITSTGRPSFAVGSGSFKLVSSSTSGNKYYYKIQAVGNIGEGSGIYLNGKVIAVANVA